MFNTVPFITFTIFYHFLKSTSDEIMFNAYQSMKYWFLTSINTFNEKKIKT